ncbi:glycosyltransferase family 4 protein [Roseivirga sp. UBA838]|uniref:glycosyltransferase family 4 protein n=1 Tax=Roseivirga sp. UBA838 TaxID=1947393 RepID=UPI00257FE2AF|nr:glycosyltransferase family 4 protein [Roseivirga sp. UBA838]
MTKIKVFLGGFINQTNAQNLNCRELAVHLDKNRFEVYTLSIKHGNLETISSNGLRVFQCSYPVKLTGLLGYVWGIYKSDVVYLPRADFLRWQLFLVRLFKRKSFKTIENIIDEVGLKTALSVPRKKLKNVLDYYRYCDQNHPITNFVGEYNFKHHKLTYDKPILPVPTDIRFFSSNYRVRSELKKLVFIGNDFHRKGLNEFIDLANKFPHLLFKVIGKGDFKQYEEKLKTNNVEYIGMVNHDDFHDVLQDVDLHFFPSRSEGFGKVTIECAALGIPSIVYDSYGAKEWINHTEGFVVSSFSEVVFCVEKLLNDSILLERVSKSCVHLANRFSSEEVVPLYQQVIEDLYAS